MKITPNLTKENFWNEMYSKFPNSMKNFCNWIDEYKKSVGWNFLFSYNPNNKLKPPVKYKYHDIPYEMQQGIWIAYANDVLNECFEQPEYLFYCGDLQDDVQRVFQETEPLLTAIQ